MTQKIVVSRRDGILRAPDGTQYRIARGKTLADAEHPAVVANPGDWVPMVITLAVDRPAGEGVPQGSAAAAEIDELNGQVTELEETLGQRDEELGRLALGLGELGIEVPDEADRTPGWLVDLVLATLAERDTVAAYGKGRDDEAAGADLPAVAASPPSVAPRTPRKRAVPPLTTRTGDGG